MQTSSACGVDQLEYQITDHNVQATVLDPSLCSIRGLVVDDSATWNLVSIHAHLGWEHTPNTRCGADAAQSEVHFIHQSSLDASARMVVAVWLDASDDDQSNDVLDYLLQQWSSLRDDDNNDNADCQDYVDDDDGGGDDERRRLDDGSPQEILNVYDLMPRGSDVYAYNGSLTTPPCTEGVTWRVLDKTVRMSMAQYTTLVELITGYRDADTCERLTVADLSQNRTVRPTMPLNDREVLHLCPTGIRRKLISFWLLGVAAVGAGAAGLLCRHRRIMSDNNQPLILTSTVTELSEPL